MDTHAWIALSMVVGFPTAFIWAFVAEVKSDNRKDAKEKADLEAWLADEKTRFRYRVTVTTIDQETFVTDPFEPHYRYGAHIWTRKFTSLDCAKEFMERTIENKAYFDKAQNVTIPLADLKRLRATIVK